MKNKTAEEVYVEMLKPAETVTLKVQHRPDDFTMIKDVPGDGFYIRYKHTQSNPSAWMCYGAPNEQLELSQNSLISVHASIYNTFIGASLWTSWKLSRLTNYVPDPVCRCSDC